MLKLEKSVDKMGYVTIAEREIDWEEVKNDCFQIPQNLLIPYYSQNHLFLKSKVPNLSDSSQ